jgi:hypothetical protein
MSDEHVSNRPNEPLILKELDTAKKQGSSKELIELYEDS